ncbi:MAG: hypothetical protein ACT4PS_08705 [Betaproteobacteria bacterium]
MDSQKLMSLALAAGIIYAAYKFGPAEVKGAALGVAGVIVARQIPYVREYI